MWKRSMSYFIITAIRINRLNKYACHIVRRFSVESVDGELILHESWLRFAIKMLKKTKKQQKAKDRWLILNAAIVLLHEAAKLNPLSRLCEGR